MASAKSWCSSSLGPMILIAGIVDQGLQTLEDHMSDVETMMPQEENTPAALEAMQEVHQEAKKLADETGHLVAQFEKILSSVREEIVTTDKSMEEWESGMTEMEEVLQKFGYVPFKAPATDEVNEPGGSVYTADSIPRVSDDGEWNVERVKTSLSTPSSTHVLDIDANDSMLDVEVTPGLNCRVSRQYIRSQASSGTFMDATVELARQPSLREKLLTAPTPVRPPVRPLSIQTPRVCLSGGTPVNMKLSCNKAKENKTPKLISDKTSPFFRKEAIEPPPEEMPKAPLMSKTTYELLGIEPPPEFYQQYAGNV